MLRIAVLVLLIGGCATHKGVPRTPPPAEVETAYTVRDDISFTPDHWSHELKADVYQPEGAGPFPAVVLVHGGGWVIGVREEMLLIAQALAKRGYVVINISYRLAPDSIFPAHLRDLQQAVRWMRNNVAEYRIDGRRIGAWGYSAGGELVSLLATLSPGDPNYLEGTRLQAVVSGGTPADLRKSVNNPTVEAYIGQKLEEAPERYRQASPLVFVSADDPPMFLYHGTWDWMISPQNSRQMKQALDQAQVPAELYLLHGGGHIGTFLFGRDAVDQGIAFLDRYLRVD